METENASHRDQVSGIETAYLWAGGLKTRAYDDWFVWNGVRWNDRGVRRGMVSNLPYFGEVRPFRGNLSGLESRRSFGDRCRSI